MDMKYRYPEYRTALNKEMLEKCCDIGARIAEETGLMVRHKTFRNAVQGREGVEIKGERVHFSQKLIKENIARFTAKARKTLLVQKEEAFSNEWKITYGGGASEVIDIETDEIRLATLQDLKIL